MNIWLPYLRAGSGTDVFTEALAGALNESGHNAVATPFARLWQFFPWRMAFAVPPPGTDIIVANSVNGFALRRPGCKLVVVEHHCVLDGAYAPHRTASQMLFHEGPLRAFEKASLKAADALVAVSAYTALSLQAALGGPKAHVILNGVDTEFFCPRAGGAPAGGARPWRLLFVGNLIRRKGADLLPGIMQELGPDFELHYTGGLRGKAPGAGSPNMKPLGRLTREALRQAYRDADLLLFPTRFEGFGYAAAEAMACATPVVATDCSSLPEIVDDGVTGRLCPLGDIKAFAAAVRGLVAEPELLPAMGQRARTVAVKRFGLEHWTASYVNLFSRLIEGDRYPVVFETVQNEQ